MKDYRCIAKKCTCGGTHKLLTELIVSKVGATEKLIEYVSSYSSTPSEILIICDENTKKYALPIKDSLRCELYVFPKNAHANEIFTATLGDYIDSLTFTPPLMIACGSGSIHDITRFCAYKVKIPFVSYPTAASVDGFVSAVAAMTMYGQKLTYPSAAPIALFADPDVYSTAPVRLTASGAGDVIGKITALYDWKAAELLCGEPLCPEIYEIMKEALDAVIDAAKHHADSRDFAEKVMNGLILSGIAMQLQGSSRPASGSEHHMSHFWEMHVINNEISALHGEKVGVGTVLALDFIKNNIDLLDRVNNIDLSAVFDKCMLSKVYGNLFDGIIKENIPSQDPELSAIAKLVRCKTESVETLKSLSRQLPDAEEIRNLLASFGAPSTLSDILLPDNDEFIKKSTLFSPYVRNRLTVAKIISAIIVSERNSGGKS